MILKRTVLITKETALRFLTEACAELLQGYRTSSLFWDLTIVTVKRELPSDYDSSTHTFYDKEHVVKTWQSVEGVQIKGNFEIDWSSSPATDLVSYDASTNRVKVGNVSINGISGRYYYSNVIEEIDMVGEYYVDKDNGILYFYASENYREYKNKCSESYDISRLI